MIEFGAAQRNRLKVYLRDNEQAEEQNEVKRYPSPPAKRVHDRDDEKSLALKVSDGQERKPSKIERLKVSPEKEYYSPGEKISVKIYATDPKGYLLPIAAATCSLIKKTPSVPLKLQKNTLTVDFPRFWP